MLGKFVPDRLYKYFPVCDYVFPIPSLRYTPPYLLNDPNEFVPALVYLIEELSEIAEKNGLQKSLLEIEQLAMDLQDEARETALIRFRDLSEKCHIGILSLTSDPLNELMWSHYASSHKGVVLEIDTNHSDFMPREGFFGIRPVRYSSKRPKASLNPSFDDILGWLYTKSKKWAYEREYRGATGIVDSLKYNGQVLGTVALSPDAIKSVYIGLGTEGGFLRKALDFCAEHGIPFGRVRCDPLEYTLLTPNFAISKS